MCHKVVWLLITFGWHLYPVRCCFCRSCIMGTSIWVPVFYDLSDLQLENLCFLVVELLYQPLYPFLANFLLVSRFTFHSIVVSAWLLCTSRFPSISVLAYLFKINFAYAFTCLVAAKWSKNIVKCHKAAPCPSCFEQSIPLPCDNWSQNFLYTDYYCLWTVLCLHFIVIDMSPLVHR